MKRKCDGCKALDISRPYHSECRLGYKTERYSINEWLAGCRPIEECPKPRTWEALVKERKYENTKNRIH